MSEQNFTLDVSRIYNGDVERIPFTFILPVSPEDTDYVDLVFHDNVTVSGEVYRKAKGSGKTDCYIEMQIAVDGEFDTHCARCASDLTLPYHVEKLFGLTKKLENDSEDYLEVRNGLLDAFEVAETLFFVGLPLKILCKEDCKGLCFVCGADLNEGECSCNRESKKNSHNGLEDLKKYLDK